MVMPARETTPDAAISAQIATMPTPSAGPSSRCAASCVGSGYAGVGRTGAAVLFVMPKSGIHPLEYLCSKWNTHSRYLDLADDRRRAFSIILVGNQIADTERLSAGSAAFTTGRRSSSYGSVLSCLNFVPDVTYRAQRSWIGVSAP
jgi:hypothetical protein